MNRDIQFSAITFISAFLVLANDLMPSRLCLIGRKEYSSGSTFPFQVDYPDNLYDGDLPFPELLGNDIHEHFEAMADEFVGHHIEEANKFSECKLPSCPGYDDVVFNPGWTRYTLEDGEWNAESVPHPMEKAYVYDCETFVTAGAFPVIGTALSSEAAYIWLAAEMCDPLLDPADWTSTSLIPLQ